MVNKVLTITGSLYLEVAQSKNSLWDLLVFLKIGTHWHFILGGLGKVL